MSVFIHEFLHFPSNYCICEAQYNPCCFCEAQQENFSSFYSTLHTSSIPWIFFRNFGETRRSEGSTIGGSFPIRKWAPPKFGSPQHLCWAPLSLKTLKHNRPCFSHTIYDFIFKTYCQTQIWQQKLFSNPHLANLKNTIEPWSDTKDMKARGSEVIHRAASWHRFGHKAIKADALVVKADNHNQYQQLHLLQIL